MSGNLSILVARIRGQIDAILSGFADESAPNPLARDDIKKASDFLHLFFSHLDSPDFNIHLEFIPRLLPKKLTGNPNADLRIISFISQALISFIENSSAFKKPEKTELLMAILSAYSKVFEQSAVEWGKKLQTIEAQPEHTPTNTQNPPPAHQKQHTTTNYEKPKTQSAPRAQTSNLKANIVFHEERFGAAVRRIRRERGMTIAELSGRVGVVRGYFSNIERSIVVPSPAVIEKISDILDPDNNEDLLMRGIMEKAPGRSRRQIDAE